MRALVAMVAMGALAVQAEEFRSVLTPGAVAYDAPSDKARRIFIYQTTYPVELVVSIEGWRKVRDAEGALTWAQEERLSAERYAIVLMAKAVARASADDAAVVVFEAQKGVSLKVLETTPGWIKAQHADGSVGFLRSSQVWGR